MNVLITGAAGFTARHLVNRLAIEKDVRIAGMDLAAEAPLFDVGDYHSVDLSDARQVLAVIQDIRPDRIFHLAGVSRGSPPEMYRANFMGTVNLLEAVLLSSPQTRILL